MPCARGRRHDDAMRCSPHGSIFNRRPVCTPSAAPYFTIWPPPATPCNSPMAPWRSVAVLALFAVSAAATPAAPTDALPPTDASHPTARLFRVRRFSAHEWRDIRQMLIIGDGCGSELAPREATRPPGFECPANCCVRQWLLWWSQWWRRQQPSLHICFACAWTDLVA